MNSQVDVCIEFAKNFTLDPVKEVLDERRKRFPGKFDENPSTFAAFEFHNHFRRCMVEVLDSLVTGYGDNIKQCLACVRPLAIILKPPSTIIVIIYRCCYIFCTIKFIYCHNRLRCQQFLCRFVFQIQNWRNDRRTSKFPDFYHCNLWRGLMTTTVIIVQCTYNILRLL